MGRRTLSPTTLLFPTPVVLVTSINQAGRPNIITLAWVGVINSEPPMVGISIRPERYSYRCIKESMQFVINLPTEEMVRKVDACGVISGRDVDKFNTMGWTPVPAQKVKPPLIDECPLQMECEVKQILPLGSHHLFLAEIVLVHVREEVQKEKGRIDISKFLPLAYCPGAQEYWSLGKCLGHHSFSKGKP